MNENSDIIKTKKAIAVFRFLYSIPEDILKHVFYQIIQDAYAQCEFLTRERAILHLAYAIDAHININDGGKIKKLCDILFPESVVISSVLLKRDFEKISNAYPQPLPEKSKMLQVFDFFRHKGHIEIKPIEELLIATRSKSLTPLVTENVFDKLGFLTLMSSILEKRPSTEHYQGLLIKWYCEGQILDVVFDTILNSNSFSIKRLLWNHLQNQCWKDCILCQLANERWNEFRTFNRMLASELDFKTAKKPEEEELVKPLGLPNKDVLQALEKKNGFFLLYNALKNMDILDPNETTLNDFKSIFSNLDEDNNTNIRRVRFHMTNERKAASLIVYFWEDFYKTVYRGNSVEFYDDLRKCIRILVVRKKVEQDSSGKNTNIQNADTDLLKKFRDILRICGYSIKKQ